jgi:hypothetical protein
MESSQLIWSLLADPTSLLRRVGPAPAPRPMLAGELLEDTWLSQMRNLERDGSLDQSAAASRSAAIRRRIQKGGDSAKPTDWGLGGCPLRGSRRGHGLRDRPGGAPRSPEQCGDRRHLDQSSRDPSLGTIAAVTSGGLGLSPRATAASPYALPRSVPSTAFCPPDVDGCGARRDHRDVAERG